MAETHNRPRTIVGDHHIKVCDKEEVYLQGLHADVSRDSPRLISLHHLSSIHREDTPAAGTWESCTSSNDSASSACVRDGEFLFLGVLPGL